MGLTREVWDFVAFLSGIPFCAVAQEKVSPTERCDRLDPQEITFTPRSPSTMPMSKTFHFFPLGLFVTELKGLAISKVFLKNKKSLPSSVKHLNCDISLLRNVNVWLKDIVEVWFCISLKTKSSLEKYCHQYYFYKNWLTWVATTQRNQVTCHTKLGGESKMYYGRWK